MSRRYAIFDAAHLGPDLDVIRGGIVLTTEVPGLSISRTARLTVAAEDFESFAEFIVYGNAGTSIANRISIGVVTSTASLTDYVGADDQGLGFRLGEGTIVSNGSTLASPGAGALGDVVGVRYTPDGTGGGVVSWTINGAPSGAVAVPASMENQPLYLACSLGSDLVPGDLEIQVNSGRDWYEYPVGGQALGWWDVEANAGTLRFSDYPFISARTDDLPYQRWEGGMTADRIEDDRGVHFWIWGRDKGQARSSAAVLTVLDSEGRLNVALGGSYRDQRATLRLVETDYGSGTDVGGYIVDSITAVDSLKRKITLKGPLAQFEVPMLKRQVRPDADQDAVGHYYPMLIGPAFSCPVRLLTKADRVYAIDALGALAVGKVRDNGVALDPTAPDYTIHAGGQRLELTNEPYGTVTVDAAVTGVTYNPPGSLEVLDGDGNPFAGTVGAVPNNWTVIEGSGPDPEVETGGGLRIHSQPGRGRMQHNTAVLEAGKSYTWKITIVFMRWWTTGGQGHIGFDRVTSGPSSPWADFVTDNWGWPPQPGGVYHNGAVWKVPVTLSGTYTPVVTHPVTLWYEDYPLSAVTARIRDLTITEIPPVEDGTEDEIEAEIAALALPLAEMMRQGIEVRCGMSPDTWDVDSAEAVDAATGYTGQGYWSSEQVVLRDYLEQLLAPYMASIYEGADGKLHVARLVDPESSATTGPDISEADILNDPVPEWDEMPGLTCSMGCRKNEHVFSADELGDALPWAARPKLTNPYRYVRRYGGPLAPGLEHARAASVLDSRLVIPNEAQNAIDHVGQLAQIPRAFFTLRVPQPDRWEPGQVVRMYLPAWIKDGGGWRNVYVVRVQGGRQDVGQLTVWTRAPWAQ